MILYFFAFFLQFWNDFNMGLCTNFNMQSRYVLANGFCIKFMHCFFQLSNCLLFLGFVFYNRFMKRFVSFTPSSACVLPFFCFLRGGIGGGVFAGIDHLFLFCRELRLSGCTKPCWGVKVSERYSISTCLNLDLTRDRINCFLGSSVK